MQVQASKSVSSRPSGLRLPALLAGAALLSACGQKGPLTLPPAAQMSAPVPAASAPTR